MAINAAFRAAVNRLVGLLGANASTGEPEEIKSTGGAAHVRLASSDVPVYGAHLHDDVLGDSVTKVALPSASGKGPDTFILDVAHFASPITLGVIMSGTTIQHSAAVSWSSTGVTGDAVADTAAWTDQAGNQAANLTKKGKFLHLTLSQGAGTAENVWAYIEGREL